MNSKTIVFIVAVIIIALLIIFSGTDFRRWMNRQQPGSHGTETPGVVETVALPTVDKIVIAVEDSHQNQYGPIELEPGERYELNGTGYYLVFTDFYTHWNWNGQPVNISYSENNVVAKIEVWNDTEYLYYGWGFKNVPFFRMSSMGVDVGNAEHYAFSLLSYEGLTIPGAEGE